MTKRIIIIGGGPGGYVAALRAAKLGAEVHVVENDELGGTCLNWGCVPTKTLLHISRLYQNTLNCRHLGIYCRNDSFRYDKMVDRKDAVVKTNVSGIHSLFKKHKINLITGRGTIKDPQTVEIQKKDGSSETKKAEAIIIATGSRPLVPGFLRCDHDRIITTTEALALKTLPSSIAVIGGSVSGCEFASLFSQLGSTVTLIEMLENLVPGQDKEISRRLKDMLKRQGVTVKTKTTVKSLERLYPEGGVSLQTDQGQFAADYCLLAMGRRLNVEDIGLEELGLDFSSNGIAVNDLMKTNIENIYAIGDVTGRFLLAHVASEQGVVAAENIMGLKTTMNYDAVPHFIYTDPEIASVGLTAEEASARGLTVLNGKAYFKTNAMAHALEQTTGFVKTVIQETSGKILGVQLFGPHVTDLLAEAVVLVKTGVTLEQIKGIIHPHPTLSETIKEAVLAASAEAIHV